MKKKVIGYIYCENKIGQDEFDFLKQAKKRNIELVLFNIAKDIDEKEIEKKSKKM